MTQSYNLSQLANNLNSSGQLDATDGLVNAVPVANGGTQATTAEAARTNLDTPSRTGAGASGSWAIIAAESNALKSATTTVGVSESAAPSSGQVLTATSATTATWQAGNVVGTILDYIGTTAPSGYVLASGLTMGNAASGGTGRANADTSTLFALLWNSMANAQAAVSGGRGASAAADYAANKTITLPDLRGRVAVGMDNMGGSAASRVTFDISGIAATTLGASGGSEYLTAHIHSGVQVFLNAGLGGGTGGVQTYTGNTAATGAGASQNMPPAYVINKIIKL